MVEAGKNTRFQPGVSGNPLGRPPTKVLRTIARELAEETDPKSRKKKARILVEALYRKAAAGYLGHFQELVRLLEEDTGTDWRISGAGGAPIETTSARDKLLEKFIDQDERTAAAKKMLRTIRHIYGLAEIPE